MGNRLWIGFLSLLAFNYLVVISLNAQVKPLQRPLLLSGNFGELRATHFHSGIDIRTGGMEGIPVLCVRDGWLARVAVSPTGYGHALYIAHADGTTTVYGHLQRFVSPIESVVRQLQYQRESFSLDEDFRERKFHFRQGDTIAYSGNTGSSGGPHLHFEIRNTETEHPLNPLKFYAIRDFIAPKVHQVYLYRLTDQGEVQRFRRLSLKSGAAGKYTAGIVRVPAGKIGIGVYAEDYMNDSWNKLGVYRIVLRTGQDTLFYMQADSCSFDQSCLIHVVKDFDCYKKRETVYRCFGSGVSQPMGIRLKNQGQIRVELDSLVPVTLTLADINGNTSQVSFSLQGGIPEREDLQEQEILRYDRIHQLELPGASLKLDSGCLAASVRKTMRVERDSVTGQVIYVLADRDIPLLKKVRFFISGNFNRQAVLCEVTEKGKLYAVPTTWKEEGLEAVIGYLNRYKVMVDTVPPILEYLGISPERRMKFRIKDTLSGIASYRGTVNGKWCLFEYDPKQELLWCRLSEPVFERGVVNHVEVVVSDEAGNKKVKQVKVKK